MEHMLTKANITALVNTLGLYGIYVRSQVIDYQYSATRSEATLVYFNGFPVVSMIIDSEKSSVTIVTVDETIEVSSYHNNGSGPFLRDSEGTEFMAIEHDAIRWFRKGTRDQSWPTPAGELRVQREATQQTLRDEIKALRNEFCPEPVQEWAV